jgi:hypothetical protein
LPQKVSQARRIVAVKGLERTRVPATDSLPKLAVVSHASPLLVLRSSKRKSSGDYGDLRIISLGVGGHQLGQVMR